LLPWATVIPETVPIPGFAVLDDINITNITVFSGSKKNGPGCSQTSEAADLSFHHHAEMTHGYSHKGSAPASAA
jgi:hypothetical protein